MPRQQASSFDCLPMLYHDHDVGMPTSGISMHLASQLRRPVCRQTRSRPRRSCRKTYLPKKTGEREKRVCRRNSNAKSPRVMLRRPLQRWCGHRPTSVQYNRFTHRVPSVQIVCKPKRVFAFLAKLQSCHAKRLLVMQAAVRTSIMHWGLCATPNCLTCRAETEGSRVNCSDRAAQVLDCPRRV